MCRFSQALAILASLIPVTFVTACSPGQSSNPEGFVSRETLPNGAELLHYTQLPAGEVARAEIDLRIGAMEGDPNVVFGDVRGIEAGPDGTLYVLDFLASEVRVFDAEGHFVRTIVTRGEGPGEITAANGILLVGDSILWIQDHGKWTMLGVSLEGEEIRRIAMPVLSYGYVWSGLVDNRGRIWKSRSHSDQERQYPPEPGLTEGTSRQYMISFDPATEVLDSIYLGDASFRTMISRNDQGGYRYQGIPNDPSPITVVDSDGGLWRTRSRSYEVARLDEEGDTVLVIASDTPAPPVTDAYRSGFVADMVERGALDRRVAEEIAGLMPETKPVISSLIVDDEGRLWVGRVGPEDTDPQFDIFSRQGKYEGSVELGFRPASFLQMRIRHGRVYAVVLDSLDVPYVVRTGTLFDPDE